MPDTKRSRKKSRKGRYGSRSSDHIVSSRGGADQKMSAVLLDFIKPYRQFADTPEAMERLVVVGITAWNAAMLPQHERDSMITKLAIAGMGGGSPIKRLISKVRTAILGESQGVADFKQVVYELIERKLQHYAENRRFILSYELSQIEGDIHLFVVSTLTPVGLEG